jgi:hypothetical protein
MICSKSLKDFAVSIEKMISKPLWLGVHTTGTEATFFVGKNSIQVEYSCAYPSVAADFAIECNKFIATVKALAEDTVDVSLTDKALVLSCGALCVNFPYAVQEAVWLDRKVPAYQVPGGLLSALVGVLVTPEQEDRFSGILLDPVFGGMVVAKFSGTVVYLAKVPVALESRKVIPLEFGKLVKAKLDIEHVLLSDEVFGFQLTTGTKITSGYLGSPYPEGYLETLHLCIGEKLVDPERYEFSVVLDHSSISQCVKRVSAMVGDEEHTLKFAITPEICRVSAKTYKGFKAEDQISVISCRGDVPPFWLHKKSLANVLTIFDSEVYIYDNGNSVLLTDSGHLMTVLLSKVG